MLIHILWAVGLGLAYVADVALSVHLLGMIANARKLRRQEEFNRRMVEEEHTWVRLHRHDRYRW